MSKPSCLACQRSDHQQCADPRTVPVDDVYLSPGELMTICCCAEAHEIPKVDVEALQAQQAEEEALEDEELDELEEEAGLPPGRIPLPESADVPERVRADYEREDLDEPE
jgi:hypothetical protein